MVDDESVTHASERNKYRVREAVLNAGTTWEELQSKDLYPIKETSMIANFGKSNYLESHVEVRYVFLIFHSFLQSPSSLIMM